MRQLIAKIRTKNLVEEVYLSEHVQCQICQIAVPMCIEIVTVRKEGDSKKVVKHERYCRAHGAEYSVRANS